MEQKSLLEQWCYCLKLPSSRIIYPFSPLGMLVFTVTEAATGGVL